MTLATGIPAAHDDGVVEKRIWVQPSVVELRLDEAEAGDGSGPDSSGFIS
jgi:hypothetical protein